MFADFPTSPTYEQYFDQQFRTKKYMVFVYDEAIALKGRCGGLFGHVGLFGNIDIVKEKETSPENSPVRVRESSRLRDWDPSDSEYIDQPTIDIESKYTQIADVYYGLRLVILQLLSMYHPQILMSTRSEEWHLSAFNDLDVKCSRALLPIRLQLHPFIDIPPMTQAMIVERLTGLFDTPKDNPTFATLFKNTATTFEGRNYFYFHCLPKLLKHIQTEIFPQF